MITAEDTACRTPGLANVRISGQTVRRRLRESGFSLRFSDGCYCVYRRSGERLTDQCVNESDRFGGGSVMVWAGICHDGHTQLKLLRYY